MYTIELNGRVGKVLAQLIAASTRVLLARAGVRGVSVRVVQVAS